MFQKKDIIFSESMGVCRVMDITKLSAGKAEPLLYYVLKDMFGEKKNCYIPVENHKVMLRPLLNRDEAIEKNKNRDNLSEMEKQEIDYVIEETNGN